VAQTPISSRKVWGVGSGGWVGIRGSPDLDAKFLEKHPVNQHLHKSIQVCKMHHNKGKLHDAAFEILLTWYMRLSYKIETTLSVAEEDKALVNVSYQPFLVDEHVKHILLLSPAPKRLTKRTLLLLLEVVTYLPTCHSSSLHLQNPHIQKLDNLQARMTWNRRKSKKKHLKHGKWDTQPGKERGKKKKKNLKSR
jgi:hypothetical protein